MITPMKYIAFAFAAILLDVVSVDSCGGSHGGHHYEPDYYMTVSPNDIQLEYLNGIAREVWISTNSPWNATTNCSWLAVDPASGKGSVKITIFATTNNESGRMRTGTIKISGEDGLEQMITVCQQAKPSDDKQ